MNILITGVGGPTVRSITKSIRMSDKLGQLTIIGVEKQMTKGVKVALNVQSYKAATLEGATEAEAVNTLYLNLEYKF